MKILGSMLILMALVSGCAHRTVVYEPAPSTTYVVKHDSGTTCEAAGGHWNMFTRRCTL